MGCPVELLAHNEDDPDGSPLQLDAEHVENNRGRLIVALSALPAGAATSAKQDTQITAEQAIQAAVVAAVGVSTGTKTCATSAGRLKAETLENVISLTVKVRSLGDASYVGVGNASGQDFRLTATDDSIELDIDPYAVYVIDDHSSTAAVVEYIARLSS